MLRKEKRYMYAWGARHLASLDPISQMLLIPSMVCLVYACFFL